MIKCSLDECRNIMPIGATDWYECENGKWHYCPEHKLMMFNKLRGSLLNYNMPPLNPCSLCGKQNDTTNECESCSEIPQSHPFRQRLQDRMYVEPCTNEVMVDSSEKRNKYRVKEIVNDDVTQKG